MPPPGDRSTPDPWNSGREGLITRIAVVAALAGLLCGFDTGVISGALDYIGSSFHLGDLGKETVVSAVLLGAVGGSIVAMAVIDRIGRRLSLVLAGGVFIVGSVASSLTPDTAGLDIARVILGIAIGISAVAAPLYIAEIAPAARRGQLVSSFQLMITIGILAAIVGWTGNLIVSFTFLTLLDGIGTAATFFAYAGVAILGFIFVWFLVPETKGRTLEEIQQAFVARAKRKG